MLEFLHLFINTSYSYLFILAILVCVKYILIVLLIFISLMTKTVEYVFICLLSLCISSLEKSLFQFFAYLSFCHGPIGLWPLLWPLITIKNPGFPGGSDGKKSACDAGDQGSIPGLGRYAGEANGYPLQYSCLENSMDREAWWAIVDGVAKNQTQVRNYAFAIKDPISRYNHIGD